MAQLSCKLSCRWQPTWTTGKHSALGCLDADMPCRYDLALYSVPGTSMFETDDTIVAISSAAGSAARGIVRLSGPDAFTLAGAVFTPANAQLDEMPGFSAADGIVHIASGNIELPCRVYVFRTPHSFTRQDIIEFHLPGCPPGLTAMADQLIAAGARSAGAGEFTARAFFSGRIDLSAAEAVADIIDAADDAQLRVAVAALDGTVYRLCSQTAAAIADILAAVEASIDLGDEDIIFDKPDDLASRLTSIAAKLETTALSAAEMPDAACEPTVVLAGRPNVGKSSLLNALCRTERAIVSAVAGTTRDVLSSSLKLATGHIACLLDAAGFAHFESPIEAAAHEAASRAVQRADVIVFVTDASDTDIPGDLQLLADVRRTNSRAPVIFAVNKIDLADPSDVIDSLSQSAQRPPIAISTATGDGLDELRQAIAQTLSISAGRSGDALGLHQRQKRCLLAAADCTQQAAETVGNSKQVADHAELVAVDLRGALAQLGQISGQIVNEDILGRIFSRFCVGK